MTVQTASDGPTPKPLHFLHIGKAAGTQIGVLAQAINESQTDWRIVKHPHRTNLQDIPPNESYFFSVRDPVSRFVSGFYSRKRKGQPRIFVDWNYHENLAFGYFEHANDLAEALFANGTRGLRAMASIRSITHTAKAQLDWFAMRGFFMRGRPPVWIIRQEHFDTDWAMFCRRIGVDTPPAPETDPKRQHRNDYADVPPLSRRARANLERWYCQDIEFYRRCSDWINKQSR